MLGCGRVWKNISSDVNRKWNNEFVQFKISSPPPPLSTWNWTVAPLPAYCCLSMWGWGILSSAFYILSSGYSIWCRHVGGACVDEVSIDQTPKNNALVDVHWRSRFSRKRSRRDGFRCRLDGHWRLQGVINSAGYDAALYCVVNILHRDWCDEQTQVPPSNNNNSDGDDNNTVIKKSFFIDCTHIVGQ